MASNTVTPTITGLDVVKQANEFYSSAFNQLLILVSILAALVGVVLPIIIQVYQKRELRIRESELEESLRKLLDAKKDELLEEINKRFKAEKETIAASLKENATAVEKKLNDSRGGIFHLQGRTNSKEGRNAAACSDWCKAGLLYCKCSNGGDLTRVIKGMTQQLLPKLSKQDLENDGLGNRLDSLVKEIEGLEHNGYLADPLREFVAAITLAKKRETPPVAK